MQRYHDPSEDPLSATAHEQERQRIAAATEEFLDKGGKIEQVGHQMQTTSPTFVINPTRTPVYAHLFVRPEEEPLRAKPAVQPITTPAKPAVKAEAPKGRQEFHQEAMASRLMVQAALGASPAAAARAIGITEKKARQVARDFNITFKRQR
jgi:hypothetical protein